MYVLATSLDEQIFKIRGITVTKDSLLDINPLLRIYEDLDDYLKSEGFYPYERNYLDNLYWCKLEEVKQKKYIFFTTRSKYKIASYEKISPQELRNQYEKLPIEDRLIDDYQHLDFAELEPHYFLELIRSTFREHHFEVEEHDLIPYYHSNRDPAKTGEAYLTYGYNLEEYSSESTSSGAFIKYTNKDKSKPAYAVISDDDNNFIEVLSVGAKNG